MAPAEAARRFAAACLLGMGLGLYSDLLRPLRPRWLWDGVFAAGLFRAALILAFGICAGDTGPWYGAGLGVGFFCWYQTLGRGSRRLFLRLWGGFFRLIKNIFKKSVKK